MTAAGEGIRYFLESTPCTVDRASALEGVEVFHAGTAIADGRLVSAGGRVLNVTARAPTIADAQARAYEAVGLIDWPGGFCRRDIGWRAIARGQSDGT